MRLDAMRRRAFLHGASTAFNLAGDSSRSYVFYTDGESADRNTLAEDVRTVLSDVMIARRKRHGLA